MNSWGSFRGVNAHALPREGDGAFFRRPRAEEARGLAAGARGAVGEVGGGAKLVGKGAVPDLAGSLPCAAPDLSGGKVERAVGDARVGVDAAVVVLGLDEVAHVGRLRVFAKDRVVVGGARRAHRAQRAALHLRGEEAGADEPVGL